MDEQVEAETPTPAVKPKRKYTRRAPHKAKPAAPKENPYVGLTGRTCCERCTADKRCVITGDSMCGNPSFGGLQPKYALQPKVVERYREAQKYLAGQAAEKKYA